MKEKYMLICGVCEGVKLQVGEIQIKNDFEQRESGWDREVDQLNKSLTNMSQTCDNFQLEIARIKITKKKTFKDKLNKENQTEVVLQCYVCENKTVTEIQLKKHNNTKHN